MALQVEIGAQVMTASAVNTLADYVVPDSPQSYPSHTLTLRNTGGTDITITAGTLELWSRRITLTGSLTGTIAAGGTMTATLDIGSYGPLDVDYRPGCPFGRLTFTGTIGGGGSISQWHEFVQRIKLETSAPATFPTQAAFARFWVLDLWVLSNAGPSGPNPFGFNPTAIHTLGHLDGWANANLQPALDAGHKGFLIHTPWGSTTGSEPYHFDSYMLWQEYVEANPGTIDTWIEALDYIDTYDPTLYIYDGNNTGNDPGDNGNFTTPIANQDFEAFCERCLKSHDHLLDRENVHLCFDSPYRNTGTVGNPEITTGEPRYELLRLHQRILARRNRKVYLEPRHEATATQWDSSIGFHRVMVDRGYWRTNPDWYADATGAADSDLGDVIRLCTSGSVDLLPAIIADTIVYGHQCCVFVGILWYRAALRTLATLYNESKDYFDYATGQSA